MAVGKWNPCTSGIGKSSARRENDLQSRSRSGMIFKHKTSLRGAKIPTKSNQYLKDKIPKRATVFQPPVSYNKKKKKQFNYT